MNLNEKKNTTSNKLTLAFFLNLIFAIIELIGGILTNSTAIIADAFHDFMDAIAIGTAVLIEKYSNKPADNKFTYGYRRFNILSAIGMSTILLIGAAGMIYQAIGNFSSVKEVHSSGMFLIAIIGILVNGFAFIKIKENNSSTYNHAHNHIHKNNANSKAIMLHLLEDVLGWIAVLVGSIIMYFTNWFWIDSILAIAIGLFISYNAIKNLYNSYLILLQKVPSTINITEIRTELLNINSITNINSLKIWTIDGEKHIASIKITTNTTDIDVMNNTKKIISTIFSKHSILDLTIEINLY